MEFIPRAIEAQYELLGGTPSQFLVLMWFRHRGSMTWCSGWSSGGLITLLGRVWVLNITARRIARLSAVQDESLLHCASETAG